MMQTFLSYEDFARSAATLDRQRLGKQRPEVLQVLKALAGHSTGWVNHPCTKMWRGYSQALVSYGVAVCDEWIKRGYKDTCRQKILHYGKPGILNRELPPWLGNEEFHASHRAVLLYKDPEWYGQFGWAEEPQEKCLWPVKEGSEWVLKKI